MSLQLYPDPNELSWGRVNPWKNITTCLTDGTTNGARNQAISINGGECHLTGRLTVKVNWLGLRVGSHLALTYIHQMNRVNDVQN